jgi:SmpA / OmlA family
MSRATALALLALAFFLAGCANFSSIAPGDSAQKVTDRVGKPVEVWKNPDGSEVWAYPQGPYGRQTFMVSLGTDRSVRQVRQVLSEEFFSQIKVGMSREDVRRLIGRPGEVTMFPTRNEEVWSWRYLQQNPMFFHVNFDRGSGTVRSTLRTEEILFMDDDC